MLRRRTGEAEGVERRNSKRKYEAAIIEAIERHHGEAFVHIPHCPLPRGARFAGPEPPPEGGGGGTGGRGGVGRDITRRRDEDQQPKQKKQRSMKDYTSTTSDSRMVWGASDDNG